MNIAAVTCSPRAARSSGSALAGQYFVALKEAFCKTGCIQVSGSSSAPWWAPFPASLPRSCKRATSNMDCSIETDYSKWQRIITVSNLRQGLLLHSSREKPSISCYIMSSDQVKIQGRSCVFCHISSIFSWLLKYPPSVRYKQQLTVRQDRDKAGIGRA